MKFTTKPGWAEFLECQLPASGGRTVLLMRCEGEARFYVRRDEESGEVLAGLGTGELELELVGWPSGLLRVASEGRVWLRRSEVDQSTYPVYGTVFTEVMARPEIAPEVRRMQELMRANQLQREAEMRQWAERLEALERANRELRTEQRAPAPRGGRKKSLRASAGSDAPEGSGERTAGDALPEEQARPDDAGSPVEEAAEPRPDSGKGRRKVPESGA